MLSRSRAIPVRPVAPIWCIVAAVSLARASFLGSATPRFRRLSTAASSLFVLFGSAISDYSPVLGRLLRRRLGSPRSRGRLGQNSFRLSFYSTTQELSLDVSSSHEDMIS